MERTQRECSSAPLPRCSAAVDRGFQHHPYVRLECVKAQPNRPVTFVLTSTNSVRATASPAQVHRGIHETLPECDPDSGEVQSLDFLEDPAYTGSSPLVAHWYAEFDVNQERLLAPVIDVLEGLGCIPPPSKASADALELTTKQPAHRILVHSFSNGKSSSHVHSSQSR
jgi:hypothetical protein